MRIRYVECCVVRDPMMKIPKSVPAWEFPILQTIYANIEDVKEVVVEDAPEPLPPDDELARVARLYGREKRDDGSPGDYWAHIAYGRGAAGAKRLEGLTREAIVELPPPADSPASGRGRKKADTATDSSE